MVAGKIITVEMEHLAALEVEEGLMQPLHKAVLELLGKVIMVAHRLVQILVNPVVAAVLALLELMVFTLRLKVEMVELDWFHLFQAHLFNTLAVGVVDNFSILEVME
jgi:hypothetical protein